jgi:hypothetical protein
MPSSTTLNESTGNGNANPVSSVLSSPNLNQTLEVVLEPLKQILTSHEHKVRNLEKRKGKLDGYKQEQEQGKDLNGDQLAAVAKFGEVSMQLDIARDNTKSLMHIQTEITRNVKKQQKKEREERIAAELERNKVMLIMMACLKELANPAVRKDFESGKNCASLLSEEEFSVIDLLTQIVRIDLCDPEFQNNLALYSEQLANLHDEKTTILTGQTTFKDAKNLLLNIAGSGYFDSNKVVESQSEPKPVEPVVEPPIAAPSVIEILASQTTNQDSAYQFIQESQIGIESPHMDPAVVAVSSYAPPQTQAVRSEPNVNTFNTSSNAAGNTVPRSQSDSVVQIEDLNLNRLSINNPMDDYDEWNTMIERPTVDEPYGETNNSAPRGHDDGPADHDPEEDYDRSFRGGFRRGGPPRPSRGNSGSMNGYRGSRMPNRMGNSGGYQNGRGGAGFQGGYRDRERDTQYFPRERFDRDEFRGGDQQFVRDEFMQPQSQPGFLRGDRYDRGDRERFDRYGDGPEISEFRITRGRTTGGINMGGNYGGNRTGGGGGAQFGGQRGMVRGRGMMQGGGGPGPRQYRGSGGLPNNGSMDVY